MEALDAIEEAWKHGAKLTENPSIQADISLDVGRILFSTNDDADAWKYIEIALMKASYWASARSLTGIGEYGLWLPQR